MLMFLLVMDRCKGCRARTRGIALITAMRNRNKMGKKEPKYLIEYETQDGWKYRIGCNNWLTVALIFVLLASACYLLFW
jgi:hypothetical protein